MSSEQRDHDASLGSTNASCSVCNVELIVDVGNMKKWHPNCTKKISHTRGWHTVHTPGTYLSIWNVKERSYGKHIVYGNLQQAAKNGCHFCKLLDRAIHQAHPKQDFNRVLILRINGDPGDFRTLNVQLFFAQGIMSEIEIFAESC